MSMGCASLSAARAASFVISLSLMRWGWSSLSSWAKCHAIASPSRSGSVARYTSPALLTALLSSLMMSPLPLIVRYFGANELSTSTPRVDLGRSRTWPTDAFTTKRGGRNFLIVCAFFGDSTMIRGFFTGLSITPASSGRQRWRLSGLGKCARRKPLCDRLRALASARKICMICKNPL